MTSQNFQVPEGTDNPTDPLRQAHLINRIAEAVKVQSEQILRLTKMVVKLRQSSDSSLGLPNTVRDGLLALLTGYVVTDIVKAVIS